VTTPGDERSRDQARDRAARDEAGYRRGLAWLGVLALGLALAGVAAFLIYAAFANVFGG
jgi:hypothetical protein